MLRCTQHDKWGQDGKRGEDDTGRQLRLMPIGADKSAPTGDLSTLLDARIYTCILSLAIIHQGRTGKTIHCFQELLICNNKKWIMIC